MREFSTVSYNCDSWGHGGHHLSVLLPGNLLPLSSLLLLRGSGPDRELRGVDSDGLCRVVGLVDAHQSVGQLKHVVTQADDDELRVSRPVLDIVPHD